MVGVLVVGGGDAGRFLGHLDFGRFHPVHCRQSVEPGNAALGAAMVPWREQFGMVERARSEIDVAAIDVLVEQWRAAIGAEAAIHVFGTAEACWLSSGPGQCFSWRRHERDEDISCCFLAHATVAEVRIV